ncbi:MAG: pre-peptidase C-terminal domain-containing protein [Anaerolineae bacterium]|nr:pre-peptidase C-terminal domain-containing protein [Anaerolineae bacterium]
MLRKMLTLLVVGTVFSTFGVALAQQAIPLTQGTPVQGEISAPQEEDFYTYQGRVGETVEISVTALPDSTLDTVLELYDSLDTLISQNDDRAPNDPNSTILVTFESDDTYRIVVRGYARIATGAYEIVVNAGQPPEPDVALPGTITLDQTVTGTLESGQVGAWNFTPAADDSYRISANSFDFDTQLRVLDSTGFEIAFDDDSGEELNAFISEIALRGGETYTIEVRSYLDQGFGPYDLTVMLAPEAPQAVPIKYGDTMEAELIAGLETRFVFEGQADDVVSIMVMSGFDASLELMDPSGVVIASDDDSGGDLQPLIDAVQLPADGTYTIAVMGFNSDDAGPFTIIFSELGLSLTPVNQSISYGETIEGFLPAGQTATYTFTANAGDIISVEVTSSFDAFVQVLDSAGSVIAEDDDSGGNLQPFINRVELPAAGNYQIVLSGFGPDANGNYSLVLTSSSPVAEVGSITYGETVEGTLVGGTTTSYTFEGSANEVITVEVGTPFDAYLELQNANGELLTADDDSGGDLQPAIINFTLPETGTYRLVLSGFSAFDEGPFSMTLSLGETVISGGGTTISYGETIETTLENGGKPEFNFTGTQGDVVTISINAPFDGLMELYDESGTLVASDDDSGGDLNPKIENFTLPSSGVYTITISAFGGNASGSFTITLQSGTEEIDYSNAAPIEYDVTVEGNLEGAAAVYSFTAEAGDIVTASVEAEFDGLLEIRKDDGTLMFQDDDSGTGLNPLISEVTLEETGDYLLILTSFEQSGRGTYTLTLTAGPSLPPATVIEIGQTVTKTLEGDTGTLFVFNGESGQKVSLTASPVELTSGLDLYLEIYSPAGELLASDDDSGWRVNPALVGFELPESGTYQVNVQNFAGASGSSFNLALQSGAVYLSPNGETAESLPLVDGQAALSLTLDAGKSRLYSFEAAQDNIFTVTTSGAVSVEVYTAEGIDQVLQNGELIIPADGMYLLVAYALEPASAEIQISLFEEVVVTPVKTAGGLLAPDAPIRDTLQLGEQKQWTFAPLFSGDYSFVLNSEDVSGRFDPYLVVLDVEGNVIAEDDDSGGNFNAQISNLPVTGGTKLILEVRSFDNLSAGDYTLVVVTENLAEVSALEGGEIAVGDVRLNQLQAGQQAEFTLSVEKTSLVNITVDGLTLPYMDVYTETGELVTRGAGSVKGLSLDAGTYRLVVYDRLNRGGNFSVRVNASE